MLDLAVDVGGLEESVSSALGRKVRLTPLGVKCTYPVFRGESDGGARVFVKVGTFEEWRKTASLLGRIGDCGLFPRLLTDAPVDGRGFAVFVMEWRESRTVFPEDMTERQSESFVAGCVKLAAALRRAGGALGATCPPELEPERLHAVVAEHVRRHPFAGRLLKGLVDLPAEERTYAGRPLSVNHGDFHAKNFGFDGDALAAVYDFDKLTPGLACGDLANALVERFSCLGMSRAARRRLREVTRRIVARAPWPCEDFARVCNVIRLQFAARRIRKHPRSAWVALDVWRRDRRIREFLECLEGR